MCVSYFKKSGADYYGFIYLQEYAKILCYTWTIFKNAQSVRFGLTFDYTYYAFPNWFSFDSLRFLSFHSILLLLLLVLTCTNLATWNYWCYKLYNASIENASMMMRLA